MAIMILFKELFRVFILYRYEINKKCKKLGNKKIFDYLQVNLSTRALEMLSGVLNFINSLFSEIKTVKTVKS